ncbi:MAG: hypothetical protein QM791_07725 [Ferruginibacter sp.]
MNSPKSIFISFIFLLGLVTAGCKKEDFKSRDTSGLRPPVDPPPVVDPTVVVFDVADALDDWEISGGQPRNVEVPGKKEGEGWLKSSIPNGEDYIHYIKRRPAPVNPNLTVENGQFVFWFYVSKVSDLKEDGQIELTSSGESDKKEYSWNLAGIIPTLVDGWNEIALDFKTAASSNDGGPDITAFNFFRIYFWTKSKDHPDLITGVDFLRFRVSPTPPLPTVSFDPAEALDDWEISGDKPRVIDNVGKKEGAGWLKADLPNGTDYIHLIKRRPTALNPNFTMDNGQFVFWFYVSKVSELKEDGQIEMTSSGESDKKEFSWNLAPIIPTLHDGWNELVLDFNKAAVSADGGPDIHAFNFFRIYFWTKAGAHEDMVVGVDDLKFRGGATPPPPVTVEKTRLFDPADALADWDIAGGQAKTVETADQKEGTGWIKSAITNGQDYIHFIKHRPLKVDPELTEDNGQFTFWWYVADASALKNDDGQIELTSSNEADKNEYAWNLSTIIPTLQNGWNEIKLNFSDAVKSGDGGPDIHGFNFFRIFFWTKNTAHADVAVGLDGLKFQVKASGPVDPVSLSFNNADALDNWEISGDKPKVIDGTDPKEGTGWIKADFLNGTDYLHFIYRRPTGVDAASKGIAEDNGQFKFWWYIPDVSLIKMDGQIELTSSGQSDADEYSWNLDAVLPTLHNGWNEVKLDFSANNGRNGNPDFSKFNFFRVYFWAKDGATHPDWQIGIDDLRIQTK